MQRTSENEIFIRRQLSETICTIGHVSHSTSAEHSTRFTPAKLRWYTNPPALLITCEEMIHVEGVVICFFLHLPIDRRQPWLATRAARRAPLHPNSPKQPLRYVPLRQGHG